MKSQLQLPFNAAFSEEELSNTSVELKKKSPSPSEGQLEHMHVVCKDPLQLMLLTARTDHRDPSPNGPAVEYQHFGAAVDPYENCS